jgi:hypothetical protein
VGAGCGKDLLPRSPRARPPPSSRHSR